MSAPRLASLRFRLFLLVFVAVMPALIIVLFLGFEQRQSAADRARDEAIRLTRLASANQERIIESTHQLLVTLSSLPQIRSGNRDALRPLLSSIVSENPLYANIGVTDPRGHVVCSALPVKSPTNLADRTWFQKAVKSGGFSVGEFQTGRITGRPTLNCAYPVTDHTGRVLVVVYAAVDLGWWNQLVAEARLPEGGSMLVIDGKGTIIARYPGSEKWVGKSGLEAQTVQTILSEVEGTATGVDVDGITRLYAFGPLKGVPNQGAFVSVGISREAAFADANRALFRGLSALLLGGALALFAAWFGGDLFVMKRVRALVDATGRLSSGDLTARTGVPHDSGELGLVARGLDEMAASLEDRQARAERAEMALRESEERFRAFMNYSPAVAWIKDDRGRYVFSNRRFEEYFGGVVDTQQGRTDDEWLTRKSARVMSDNDRKVIQTGEPMEFVERITAPGGRVTTWVFFKFPVEDAQGRRYVGAVGIDITERQHLEEQLRQSQKMEAVGKLAAGVAHDFNNLLTVIQGYSELILNRNSPVDVVRGQVGEVHKAAVSAARLTRQLLAFTRQEVVQPVVLDLNAVVADMHKMLKRLIGADIEFSILSAAALGKVKVDPGQIEQIIMNLVVNARDAMPSGGKLIIETANAEVDEVESRSREGLKPGRYIMLAVTDTGTGMDADTCSRIFEPFFTTKSEGKGTGLGLATVYGIVKGCEGDIKVYSEPGQGATFKIYLPEATADQVQKTGREQSAVLPNGSETILVVENEEAVSSLVSSTLEPLGYRVLVAPGGPEAITLLGAFKGKIHLVITDMVMPRMSGPEFVARFAERRRGVRILYMSGYAEKAIVHRGLMDPNASFLAKPFGPRALARKVREVLDGELKQAA